MYLTIKNEPKVSKWQLCQHIMTNTKLSETSKRLQVDKNKQSSYQLWFVK